MLLSSSGSNLKSLYRAPLDCCELFTTGLAHKILVNSFFTCDTFVKTFSNLYRRGHQPEVLHPAVHIRSEGRRQHSRVASTGHHGKTQSHFFLSINRFERKKDLRLALRSYSKLRRDVFTADGYEFRLILAGGYDERLIENVEYFEELERECFELGIEAEVVLLPSISSSEKLSLLDRCLCVLYTPEDEHFGIVPLEAMAAAKPVLACNTGGPIETVVHGITGFLCAPNQEDYFSAMKKLSQDPTMADRMGLFAQWHVESKFGRNAFGSKLNSHLLSLSSAEKVPVKGLWYFYVSSWCFAIMSCFFIFPFIHGNFKTNQNCNLKW